VTESALSQADVEKWLRFLDLSPGNRALLREIHDSIRPLRERIIDEFYRIILAEPELAALLSDPDTLARLKRVQVDYICTLLTAERNVDYIQQRFRIGMAHHRVGLDSRWFLNSYFHLERLIADHFQAARGLDEAAMRPYLEALHRAVIFDTSLTVDAYVQTLSRQLNEETERVREANRMKSEFLSRMSHELRTPLSAIINFTDYVRTRAADQLSPRFLDRLDRVLGNSDHLLALINDILDMSRIEAGRMELHPEWVDTARLIEDIEALCEPLSRPNDNTFVLENRATVTALYTDPLRLRQVVVNLLNNAFKFTHHGTVRLRLRNDESRLFVAVEDTGVGIARENLRHIFEEFRQVNDRGRAHRGGTGLGLTISQQLCNLMGGRLEVESELGVGSTFHFSLPLVLDAAAHGDSGDSVWILRAGEHGRLPPRPRPDTRRVLAIDDDPDVLLQLHDCLEPEGYQVVGCFSVADGEAVARAVQPDVILMDVKFPQGEEWQAIGLLRRDERLRRIPMVMLSVLDRRARAQELGMAGCLPKPLEPERLKALLAELLAPDPVG